MASGNLSKRKRESEVSTKPKKKVAFHAPASTATVSSVLRPKFSPPIIATAPGINLPTNLPFYSYVSSADANPKSKSKSKKNDTPKDLLLHSTAHHTLDYTAKDETRRGLAPLMNHFIGVYDPQTGKLQVVEAKKLVVRGVVRDKKDAENESAQRDAKQTMMELKADLGETFGTKKAKKAIRDTVLNAISPQKKPGEKSSMKIDNAAKAVLNTVGEVALGMATREELQAVVDGAKPVPKANLEAVDIEDVYDPKVIIGSDILNLVPIREWQEKARHKESIQVPSRFVAARVNNLALNDEALTRLRVLRYYYFVLLFFLHTKPGKQRGTRQLPAREKLREALAPAPEAVIENIRRKFSDAGEMRKFHIDLLMTHCCAFAAIVDNFEVDTQNLKDDLHLDQKAINSYFHEIGGRVKPVTNKQEGRTTHLAKLRLPLDFPKQRHIAPRRK